MQRLLALWEDIGNIAARVAGGAMYELPIKGKISAIAELSSPYPRFPAILAISRITLSVPVSLSASFSKSSATTMRMSGRT